MELNKLIINACSVEKNIHLLQNHANKTPLLVMVKANAYGTLLSPYTKLLESLGVNYFGVAFVQEALILREQGVLSNIVVLYTHPSEAQKIISNNLTPCIADKELLDTLEIEAARQNKQIKVHLNLDSGMKRLGCTIDTAFQLAKRIDNNHHFLLEGVMTHLAAASNVKEITFTKKQIALFDLFLKQLQAHKIKYRYAHIANSAALFQNLPLYEMVRLGLALLALILP